MRLAILKLNDIDLTDIRHEKLLEAQKEVKDKYYKCDMISENITLLYSQIPVGHVDRDNIFIRACFKHFIRNMIWTILCGCMGRKHNCETFSRTQKP